MNTTFETAVRNSPLVRQALRAGLSHAEIICLLVQQNEQLLQKAIKLQRIAPVRYKLPDGPEMIYRCPTNIVPLEEFE